MPPKGGKKQKKGNGNEATGASQNANITKRERAHLKIDMKNFDQPSVHKSLASQGMILRGRMIRAGQDNTGKKVYTELTNPTRELERQKEIPPQPPPLPRRSRSLSPPPYPALGPPLKLREGKELETLPPPTFSDLTEMSMDDYNKVSLQLKQIATFLNKK